MTDESKHTKGSGTTTLVEEERAERADHNRDPITGEPGSHPVGTGVGAVTGAAAGAAVGAAGGPVGAVVGGAVGAIVGGLAGHGVAEQVNPTAEDAYWRQNYASRDYVEKGHPYEAYQPAYRYGWEARSRHPERTWDEELEHDLERGWAAERGASGLDWRQARPATRDAWQRLSAPEHGAAGGPATSGAPDALGAPAVQVFEADFWRETWPTRPYAGRDLAFEDYEPAYRYGWEARSRHRERSWDSGLERDLESGWEKAKGSSRLTWERAKLAVRDAWDRFERKVRR